MRGGTILEELQASSTPGPDLKDEVLNRMLMLQWDETSADSGGE